MLSEYIKYHNGLLVQPNYIQPNQFGFCKRYQFPILTPDHIPPAWKYDLNPKSNPFGLLRLGINAIFNPGAIFYNDKYYLMCRVEGYDRKSFFALAESESGVDKFVFKNPPIQIPQLSRPDTNVYDMRLTQHEDGWIYGLFCTERRPEDAPAHDQTIAEAACGIIRSKNLIDWERLPDLKTQGSQQRNVVLHPEFVNGQYGLYTRPQDGFISTGSGGGIGWALSESIENAKISNEEIIDRKWYHTISELKNGQGPTPIKTPKGWLHLAHGVRNTAAGLRYVLYVFMTDLAKPWQITHKPGGYYMAPENEERVGDVSNVLFCNGWIDRPNGEVYIYYASSDTRIHVATTSIDHLIDYCENTPEDEYTSHTSVETRRALIERNEQFTKQANL